jgi:hypothetical protein
VSRKDAAPTEASYDPAVSASHILFIIAVAVVGYCAYDRLAQRAKKRKRGGRRY